MLKDLGIVGNNGMLNENVVQANAESLKRLLPLDLLQTLIGLKDHALWDMVIKTSLSSL